MARVVRTEARPHSAVASRLAVSKEEAQTLSAPWAVCRA